MVLITESSKSIIIIELTVPFEQNIHKAHYERKVNEYAARASPVICKNRVDTSMLLCVEVGSSGFVINSNACSFQSIFSHDF